MELVDNMIRAKLFKDKDNVSEKYYDVAGRVERFINSNSIDDVCSVVEIKRDDYPFFNNERYSYVTDLLLIYREGDE